MKSEIVTTEPDPKPPPRSIILNELSDVQKVIDVLSKAHTLEILLFLKDVGIARFNEICEVFGLNPAVVNKALNSLLEAGLIQKGSSYKLTRKGALVLIGLDIIKEKISESATKS